MTLPLTLTIDLEDPTEEYMPGGRWVQMTYRALALFDELDRKATFFTVGHVAKSVPELVKDIASRGHEIAYHTHDHVFLTQTVPELFRRETREDKARFEQLLGKPLVGFRAPGFSLMRQTLWTLDSLKEQGFVYSSSVMPTGLSRFGLPEAPPTTFRWPNGLIEFPLPVGKFGPWRVPYSGGVYLYALPLSLSKYWAAHKNKGERLWTYLHPFDLDLRAPFRAMPRTPMWASFVMWMLRKNAEKKIRAMLALGKSGTMGEVAAALELKSLPLIQ